MSQTQSSYDFDHYTEEESEQQSAADTFREQSLLRFQEEPASELHVSELHDESSQSMIQAPVSYLQSTFQQLDKEGKGVITKSVLKKATMVTAQRYDKRIIREEIDRCGREIDYSRFVEIFQRANVGDGGVNEWLYSLYDQQGKGYISEEDLRRVSNITGVQLSQEELAGMLSTERNGGNKRVDYQDFRYIMQEEVQYL